MKNLMQVVLLGSVLGMSTVSTAADISLNNVSIRQLGVLGNPAAPDSYGAILAVTPNATQCTWGLISITNAHKALGKALFSMALAAQATGSKINITFSATASSAAQCELKDLHIVTP